MYRQIVVMRVVGPDASASFVAAAPRHTATPATSHPTHHKYVSNEQTI
jgi:hypothetical protein